MNNQDNEYVTLSDVDQFNTPEYRRSKAVQQDKQRRARAKTEALIRSLEPEIDDPYRD